MSNLFRKGDFSVKNPFHMHRGLRISNLFQSLVNWYILLPTTRIAGGFMFRSFALN